MASDSVAGLEAQLVAAKEAEAKANDAVDRAASAFERDGTDSAGRQVMKAKEALVLAAEHVLRAQRLLDARRAEEAAAHRAELEAREQQLLTEITTTAAMAADAPLVEAEAQALRQVADIRLKRLALADQLNRKADQVRDIRRELGTFETNGIRMCSDGVMRTYEGRPTIQGVAGSFPVVERLKEMARAYAWADPMQGLLVALQPTVDSYRRRP